MHPGLDRGLSFMEAPNREKLIEKILHSTKERYWPVATLLAGAERGSRKENEAAT